MKNVYTEDQAKSISDRIDNKKAIANQSKNDRRIRIEQYADDRRLKEQLDLDVC